MHLFDKLAQMINERNPAGHVGVTTGPKPDESEALGNARRAYTSVSNKRKISKRSLGESSTLPFGLDNSNSDPRVHGKVTSYNGQ